VKILERNIEKNKEILSTSKIYVLSFLKEDIAGDSGF
jgi:hypothetical protein